MDSIRIARVRDGVVYLDVQLDGGTETLALAENDAMRLASSLITAIGKGTPLEDEFRAMIERLKAGKP